MNAQPEEQVDQGPAKVEVQCLPSLCRGLYHRVAQKVGCDPSYVSRVARGERTSPAVSEALRAEIQLAFADSEDRSSRKRAKSVGRGSAPNRRIIGAIWPR